MLGDIQDLIEILSFPIIIVILVFLVIVGAGSWYGSSYCSNLQELNPDRSFEWRFAGGCFIETDGGMWYPVSEVQFIQDKPIIIEVVR